MSYICQPQSFNDYNHMKNKPISDILAFGALYVRKK